jgi:hypothetical protein
VVNGTVSTTDHLVSTEYHNCGVSPSCLHIITSDSCNFVFGCDGIVLCGACGVKKIRGVFNRYKFVLLC